MTEQSSSDFSMVKSKSNLATQYLLDAVLSEKNERPSLKLMMRAMKDAGCAVIPKVHIVIEKCNAFHGYGGFDSSNNEIVLCEEKFGSIAWSEPKQFMDTILTHELIHAFDHCRANVDFYNNPRHSMCSEIRAAALSGQCTISKKPGAAVLGGVKKYHQRCVKTQAMNSFKALHPNWSEKDSKNLLDSLFSICYYDTEPFDRVPLTNEQAFLSYKAYISRNRYHV
uniref:mitochondrial inner membrane protease ATP23 homolog n=1 Tax=Styela clava TaxID=7725 RepID=UPI00193AC5FB|nr:mitochondrial inner membrane protease ATP23 homolog [Styela clava]XP_039264192.1 mitochondrial inner membrane protease ATP23 homolog [Styela clava]XP_039264200.1 mitochondrial inner membrane protease ATP23 homolog [Styela clava]